MSEPAVDGPVAPGRTILVQQGEPDPWPQFLWRWVSRAWRPFCGWSLGCEALSDVYVRWWQVTHGLPVSPVEWMPITAFGTALVIARSYDKKEGTA